MFCMQHFLKQHSFLQASDLTLRGYITTFNEPVRAGYVALVQKTKNKNINQTYLLSLVCGAATVDIKAKTKRHNKDS